VNRLSVKVSAPRMFVSEIELSDCPSSGLFKHHGGTVFQQPASRCPEWISFFIF
jgi:hypothetical protein